MEHPGGVAGRYNLKFLARPSVRNTAEAPYPGGLAEDRDDLSGGFIDLKMVQMSGQAKEYLERLGTSSKIRATCHTRRMPTSEDLPEETL